MSYNLTEKQRSLMKWIVDAVRAHGLSEEFRVLWVMSDRGYLLVRYQGQDADLPEISEGLLDALAAAEMLLCERQLDTGGSEHSRRCVLTQRAFDAVDSDFETPIADAQPRVTIGAIIHAMSGGNVQAAGIVQDAQISQVVNDPELLRSQLAALTENLMREAKPALNTDDLVTYGQFSKDLREELLREKPDASLLQQLVRTLSFLGDVEGSIGLMVRVWPYLHPILLIAAARLG